MSLRGRISNLPIRTRPASPRNLVARPNGPRVKLVIFLIERYRDSALHKRLHRNGARCRFVPSCSEYAIRAVRKHGLLRGALLTGWRLYRCNPENKGPRVDFP